MDYFEYKCQKYKYKINKIKNYLEKIKENSKSLEDKIEFMTKEYNAKIKNIEHENEPEIFIDDIKHTIKYDYDLQLDTLKKSIHLGQRKLFLTEFQFLTNHLKDKNDECYVVYAGAAPSMKIYLLHELFPNVKFILVDPNPFNISIDNVKKSHLHTKNSKIVYLKHNKKKNGNAVNYFQNNIINLIENAISDDDILDFIENSKYSIYLWEDVYSLKLSKLLVQLKNRKKSKNKKIYFWSDIRTGLYSKKPSDLDIIWNSAQQFNWINILKPDSLMLKFRCPFYLDKEIVDKYKDNEPFKSDFELAKKNGVDFLKNYYNKKFNYFKGQIYLQPFAPISSTELRLVFDNINNLKNYDCFENEEKLFFHNNVTRYMKFYKNIYADKKIGFDNCFDCSLESFLWKNYKEKYFKNKNFDVLKYVKKLHDIVGTSFFKNKHGHFYSKMTLEKLLK